MIYLPENNTYNKCYVVQSDGVIRAYDTTPSYNTSYNYRDYYIKSDYIFRDGSGTWNNYTTLPICLDNNIITSNYYYRYDFANICIIFMTCFFFIFYLPFKLYQRWFRRLH